MIFGTKDDDGTARPKTIESAVFLLLPRRLDDGRIAWLQSVWRISVPVYDSPYGTSWHHTYKEGEYR